MFTNKSNACLDNLPSFSGNKTLYAKIETIFGRHFTIKCLSHDMERKNNKNMASSFPSEPMCISAPSFSLAEDLDDVTEEKIALVKSAAGKVTEEITIKLKGWVFSFPFPVPFRSTNLGGLHDFREKILHKHCKIIRGWGKWGCVGGILGGGYNMKTKICKQNYWYLSEWGLSKAHTS